MQWRARRSRAGWVAAIALGGLAFACGGELAGRHGDGDENGGGDAASSGGRRTGSGGGVGIDASTGGIGAGGTPNGEGGSSSGDGGAPSADAGAPGSPDAGSASSCADRTKNGSESDVDCGGACPPCAVGALCNVNADCALPESGSCVAPPGRIVVSTCAPASCFDGIRNGSELDVDCPSDCARCALGRACTAHDGCESFACENGICVSCRPGARQCAGTSVETCSNEGSWAPAEPCVLPNATPSCAFGVCGVRQCADGFGNCDGLAENGCEVDLGPQGACPTPPSCFGLAATCGPSGDQSCCSVLAVPQGTYPRGRSETGSDAVADGWPDEVPEHAVTVSAFALDAFEVTVGRFRRFVEAYPGSHPSEGDGAHPRAPGTGWGTGTLAHVDQASLIASVSCDAAHRTWTDAPGGNETKPINCIGWFEAFAFCAWDGGRLPSEAEWEYVAAGGDENRLYPWGAAPPDCTMANGEGCGGAPAHVGSRAAGAGRWGHLDLAGNVLEWALDYYYPWYSEHPAVAIVDPVFSVALPMIPEPPRIVRGGSFSTPPSSFRAAIRRIGIGATISSVGVRCAR